jgi:hypothetical protein
MDQKYNGWTNYATWRVNLEIFDGMDVIDVLGNHEDVYELAHSMEHYVKDWFEQEALDAKNKGIDVGLMSDYALAFLSDVNWREIANFYTVSEGYFEEATK